LFIADIVGPHGFDVIATLLPRLKQEREIDIVIANGENATQGRGLDDKSITRLFNLGIHVITSGNHIWQRRKYLKQLESNPNILRPLNYPPDTPGHGSCIFETDTNVRVGIINLQGRSFMFPIDCPFQRIDQEINDMKEQGIHCIFVDFHAEATAEKIALGYYIDGRVSAVLGTHTHVQTADEQLLPKGTAYLTDAGMTGPHRSVIGMNINTAIQRFITQVPHHYTAASAVDLKLCGAYIAIDPENGIASSIERIKMDI